VNFPHSIGCIEHDGERERDNSTDYSPQLKSRGHTRSMVNRDTIKNTERGEWA